MAVDISIWLIQAQVCRGGKNPELRTLFYKLLKFLALPIHPLFVYDGEQKPPFKRGKVAKHPRGNPIVALSRTLIDLFNFPRHDAPGEAEAECARLQKAGVVDAVMSNDADALMFGSTFTLMNFSREQSTGTTTATHVTLYCAQVEDLPANISLSPAGMVLFAMLSGGDYLPSGVPKCGKKLAGEIAKAGFGDDLLEIIGSDDNEVELKLMDWRTRLQYELDENESGYFKRKNKAVRIPNTFPDRDILSYHANPIVSSPENIERLKQRLTDAWDRDISLQQIRSFVDDWFDWKHRSGAKKLIRQLAEPLVSYRLRLRKPLAENGEALSPKSVCRSRTHYSTDGLTQLQFEIIPADIVGLDLDAEEPNDTRDEEDDSECTLDQNMSKASNSKQPATRYNPCNPEKVWIFETLANIGIPDVVERWRQEQIEKATRTKRSTSRKKKQINTPTKHGSILRYATVTKPRSGLNASREAQLLDGPSEILSTEGKPDCETTNNNCSSPTPQESSSSPRRYLQQKSVKTAPSQAVDDLISHYSLACTELDNQPFRHPSDPDYSYINIEGYVASLDDGVASVGETSVRETRIISSTNAASTVINQASISSPAVTLCPASNRKWQKSSLQPPSRYYANESVEEVETPLSPPSHLSPKKLSTLRGRRSLTKVQINSHLDMTPSNMTAHQPEVISILSSSEEGSPIPTTDRARVQDISSLNSSPTPRRQQRIVEEVETPLSPPSHLPPKKLSTPRGRRRSSTNVQTRPRLNMTPSKMTAQPEVISIFSSPEETSTSTTDRARIQDSSRLNSSPTPRRQQKIRVDKDAACEGCLTLKSVAAAEKSSRMCDQKIDEVGAKQKYIPSINVYDGFWKVESTKMNASTTQSQHVNNATISSDDESYQRKNQIEGVSVLDLS